MNETTEAGSACSPRREKCMRQRKPKNLSEKLNSCDALLVSEPEQYKGNWRPLFSRFDDEEVDISKSLSESKLFLEIGAGKGKFLLEKASSDRDGLYLGFEGRDSILLRALEKTAEADLRNLLFSRYYVRDLLPVFATGELNGIFLNFSDPWPKERHSRRRLTNPEYLKMYEYILAPGGFIEFKTDNRDFFAYSSDAIRDSAGFNLVAINEDLHCASSHSDPLAKGGDDVPPPDHSCLSKTAALSEYEERFIRWNRCIFYIKGLRI